MRKIINNEKLDKKYGVGKWGEAERQPKLMDSFMEQWNKTGKNSPCQMCNIQKGNKLDDEGRPVYEFKPQHSMNYLLKPKKQAMLTDIFNMPSNNKIKVEDFITKEDVLVWIDENYYHSNPLDNSLKLYAHETGNDLERLRGLFKE